MKLRGIHISPYYERAYLALEVKQATGRVETGGVPGGFGSDELRAENPIGKIPYLMLDEGTCLPEGQMIVEYFDRVFDGPKLEPTDPLHAVQSRLVARVVDTYLAPQSAVLSRPLFGRVPPDEAAMKEAIENGLPQALDVLEAMLHGGQFAIGNRLTFADIAMIPHTFFFVDLLSDHDLQPFEGRPKYAEWWDENKGTALVRNSHARMKQSFTDILASLN